MRDYLKRHRLEQKLTQKQLADAVGISLPYYCLIENGKRGGRMGMEFFAKLANALGENWDDLFNEERKWKEATQNGTTEITA